MKLSNLVLSFSILSSQAFGMESNVKEMPMESPAQNQYIEWNFWGFVEYLQEKKEKAMQYFDDIISVGVEIAADPESQKEFFQHRSTIAMQESIELLALAENINDFTATSEEIEKIMKNIDKLLSINPEFLSDALVEKLEEQRSRLADILIKQLTLELELRMAFHKEELPK